MVLFSYSTGVREMPVVYKKQMSVLAKFRLLALLCEFKHMWPDSQNFNTELQTISYLNHRDIAEHCVVYLVELTQKQAVHVMQNYMSERKLNKFEQELTEDYSCMHLKVIIDYPNYQGAARCSLEMFASHDNDYENQIIGFHTCKIDEAITVMRTLP